MKTRRLATFALFLTLCLAACAPAALTVSKDSNTSGGNGGGSVEGYAAAPAATAAPAALADQASGSPAAERLVIRNANLSLIVADPAAAADRIAAMAASMGGFVVTSNTSAISVDAAGNKIMQANLTIRVPAAQLDTALAQMRAMAVEVKSESISGQDVTSQYTDLQSHLRNLEAAEKKLQQIMDGATKTEDVLAVYNQLVGIRDQIEQVKGQMLYFEQSAALSAVTADLIPDALSQPITVGGWHPQGVAKDAVEALVRALQGLTDSVIWFALYVLPLALVILVPLVLVIRLLLRLTRKKKPTASA